MLKILADLGTRRDLSGHWRRWVRYFCVCGTEGETRVQSIKSGKLKSCGCLDKAMSIEDKKKGHAIATIKYRANHRDRYKKYARIYYNKDIELSRLTNRKRAKLPNNRYYTLLSNAKQRQLEVLITREEHAQLLLKPCHYCNISLINESGGGLDRINNLEGYKMGNVLPCCGTCNRMRGTWLTVEEMELAMWSVLNYRKQKGKYL